MEWIGLSSLELGPNLRKFQDVNDRTLVISKVPSKCDKITKLIVRPGSLGIGFKGSPPIITSLDSDSQLAGLANIGQLVMGLEVPEENAKLADFDSRTLGSALHTYSRKELRILILKDAGTLLRHQESDGLSPVMLQEHNPPCASVEGIQMQGTSSSSRYYGKTTFHNKIVAKMKGGVGNTPFTMLPDADVDFGDYRAAVSSGFERGTRKWWREILSFVTITDAGDHSIGINEVHSHTMVTYYNLARSSFAYVTQPSGGVMFSINILASSNIGEDAKNYVQYLGNPRDLSFNYYWPTTSFPVLVDKKNGTAYFYDRCAYWFGAFYPHARDMARQLTNLPLQEFTVVPAVVNTRSNQETFRLVLQRKARLQANLIGMKVAVNEEKNVVGNLASGGQLVVEGQVGDGVMITAALNHGLFFRVVRGGDLGLRVKMGNLRGDGITPCVEDNSDMYEGAFDSYGKILSPWLEGFRSVPIYY